VAAAEGFQAEDTALWEIARNADGALRDALSLAEQALALGSGNLTADAVNALLGGSGRAELERFASLLRSAPADAAAFLKELLDRGVSPERFLDALFPLFRDMWVYSMWGDAAFSGLTLSEEEKKFLASEVPGWGSGVLGRLVSVCASLYPRVRQGLRSDVFSGLLAFGLIGAMGDEPTGAVALPTAAPPERFAPKEAAPFKKTQSQAPTVKAEPVAPPAREAARPGGALREGWAARFSSLWDSDLSLCAAIIDATLSAAGGELVIDCSGASPVSRAVLGSARAQIALETAFGLKQENAPMAGLPDEENQAPQSARPINRVSPGEMSMEALSSFLGADLLMAKPQSGANLGDLCDGEDIVDAS
jgi:DNA polymerase-3 subunit gamma/tau